MEAKKHFVAVLGKRVSDRDVMEAEIEEHKKDILGF
jgi:hypothetical protein